MTNRICMLFSFVALVSIAMAAQTEPVLISVNIPKYPPLARLAHIQGTVQLTFTLAANAGEPTNIEVESGHPLLKSATIENLKTWRFENRSAIERKYKTTYNYTLFNTEPVPTVT